MTEKLYETSAYCCHFTATVTAVEESGDGYAVILDRTAFFPQAGGQAADRGTLGGRTVTNVTERAGEILHHMKQPPTPGETLSGAIDWDFRFRNMQCHTGEHILSGTLHRLYGAENVGFHLGAEEVTLDLDLPLTAEQLAEAERQANAAVFANLAVRAYYPAPEELGRLHYRAKLDLTENVRIVSIEGVDVCACCAPHVARTGEVGLLKIVAWIRYKGGVRLHLLCAADALRDYAEKQRNIEKIAALLSAKQPQAHEAVLRLYESLEEEKKKNGALRAALREERLAALGQGNVCLFYPDLEGGSVALYAEAAALRCGGIAAVFTASPGGYRYAIASKTADLAALLPALHQALGGKGGGRGGLVQGSVTATEAEIRRFWEGI